MKIIIITLIPTISATDCPFEEENCVYPGDCGRYIDSDNNQLCDYSEIPQKTERRYYLITLTIITLALYFITSLLSKYKKIKFITHRRIWNTLLLISFLIMAILGIILTINVQYPLALFSDINRLFWHVEAGIIFSIISIFHIFWHIRYYKNIFK